VTGACSRPACSATLTLGLFGSSVALEVDGWSAEGAGAGLTITEERAGQRGLFADDNGGSDVGGAA